MHWELFAKADFASSSCICSRATPRCSLFREFLLCYFRGCVEIGYRSEMNKHLCKLIKHLCELIPNATSWHWALYVPLLFIAKVVGFDCMIQLKHEPFLCLNAPISNHHCVWCADVVAVALRPLSSKLRRCGGDTPHMSTSVAM